MDHFTASELSQTAGPQNGASVSPPARGATSRRLCAVPEILEDAIDWAIFSVQNIADSSFELKYPRRGDGQRVPFHD